MTTNRNNGKITWLVLICILALGIIIAILSHCFGNDLSNKSINFLIDHAPHVRGVVETVEDGRHIIVRVDAEDEIYKEHSVIWVTLNVVRSDSSTDFEVGDDVVIYYDGNISDSSPGKLETVYAILD